MGPQWLGLANEGLYSGCVTENIYFRMTWGLLMSGDAKGGCLFVGCPGALRLPLHPQHPRKGAAGEQYGDHLLWCDLICSLDCWESALRLCHCHLMYFFGSDIVPRVISGFSNPLNLSCWCIVSMAWGQVKYWGTKDRAIGLAHGLVWLNITPVTWGKVCLPVEAQNPFFLAWTRIWSLSSAFAPSLCCRLPRDGNDGGFFWPLCSLWPLPVTRQKSIQGVWNAEVMDEGGGSTALEILDTEASEVLDIIIGETAGEIQDIIILARRFVQLHTHPLAAGNSVALQNSSVSS